MRYASRFPCNNTQTAWLQNLLPPRLLLDGDSAALPIAPGDGISDLNYLQNRAVWLIDEVYRANATLRGEVERMWDRGMCVAAGRAIGREMFTMGIYRIPVLASAGVRLGRQSFFLKLQLMIDETEGQPEVQISDNYINEQLALGHGLGNITVSSGGLLLSIIWHD